MKLHRINVDSSYILLFLLLQAIHSQYIVVGAIHPICCSYEVAMDIYSHLDPPFEELFDEAEEHAISVLYEAWHMMLLTDQKTYNKVFRII